MAKDLSKFLYLCDTEKIDMKNVLDWDKIMQFAEQPGELNVRPSAWASEQDQDAQRCGGLSSIKTFDTKSHHRRQRLPTILQTALFTRIIFIMIVAIHIAIMLK